MFVQGLRTYALFVIVDATYTFQCLTTFTPSIYLLTQYIIESDYETFVAVAISWVISCEKPAF